MNIIRKVVFGIDDETYTLDDLMKELKRIHNLNQEYIRVKKQLRQGQVGCFSQQKSIELVEIDFKRNHDILNNALGYLEYAKLEIEKEKKRTRDTDRFVELTFELVEIDVKISFVKDYIELNNNLLY